MREASNNILCYIDDDAIIENNYFSNVLSFFNKNKNTPAAGGKIVPKFETPPPKWVNKYIISLFSVLDMGNKVKKFPGHKFPIGANMIIKKKLLESIGGFNTSLGRTGTKMLAGEEKEVFFKIRNINDNILYIPDAKIWHVIPGERMTISFIKKQALGIGESERIRVSVNKMIKAKRFLLELFKWSEQLFCFGFIFCHFLRERNNSMKFRFWVSKGLIKDMFKTKFQILLRILYYLH